MAVGVKGLSMNIELHCIGDKTRHGIALAIIAATTILSSTHINDYVHLRQASA